MQINSKFGTWGLIRAFIVVGLAVVVSVEVVRRNYPVIDAKSAFDQARIALDNKDLDRAELFALMVNRKSPLWARSRLVAGEAAMRAGRLDKALELFNSIPRDGSNTATLAVFSIAEIQRDRGQLSGAKENYLFALANRPSDPAIYERLIFLMGVAGQYWESEPYYDFLLQNGQATLEELVLIGDLERPNQHVEYLEKCVKNFPEDPLVQLGRAKFDLEDGRPTEAYKILQTIVQSTPDLLAAQSLLGSILVDGDESQFKSWHDALPIHSDDHPDIWMNRALWARRQGNLRVAARCFWETLRRAPMHRRATYQLGQALTSLGLTSGQEFATRSVELFQLTQDLEVVMRSQGRSESAMKRVTNSMEHMGRIREAYFWALNCIQLFPYSSWPREMEQRISLTLYDNTPRVIDSENLTLKFDLSNFPDHHELFKPISQNSNGHSLSLPLSSTIRFEEEVNIGLTHVYFNGSDPLVEEIASDTSKGTVAKPGSKQVRIKKRPRMFEQTGGGVAVLDFDLDTFPDLYFTQGAEWKFGSDEPVFNDQYTDRLYRNEIGKSFIDVSHQAGVVDRGFGQGCSVGDIDNDGFPDLYVANIGRNQLYRNNGDGTFADISNSTGLTGNDWTASCVIVDLNADGLPDLFDVNYVTGPHVYDLVCNGHGCSPKGFQGIPALLQLNQGDGTFESVPDATPKVGSKGLGIISADIQTRGRPCLLIANDQVPNFFLCNNPSDDRFNIRLEDEAFVRGLAFNEDGMAMASMGIAADDINGDGLIDFYVTTFKDEPRILFLQNADGFFVDGTKSSGLDSAKRPFVGWGTQFLDADRDGEPDIVATNGHVDDYRPEGGGYQMPTQFFHNKGAGDFQEQFAVEIGSFFEKKHLGRGLARLDWNQDGRMDFVVSNIGDPVSLVTNQSTKIGHFINFRLHSRHSARDAIGSLVTVTAGNRHWIKQLVAGDGYMASNERLLQFGIGIADRIECVEVQWPSGTMTRIQNLSVDCTVDIIEDAPRCYLQFPSNGSSTTVDVDDQP